jgi:DNA-binding beta-propeller fold protein YncE
LAVAPDGSVFISNEDADTVYRVARGGAISTVVGPGSPNLIRNPGCEVCTHPACYNGNGEPYWQGNFYWGWECILGDVFAADVYQGARLFNNHASVPGAEIYQDVDVSPYAATIAAGAQQFSFGVVVRDAGDNVAPVRLVVEYRDGTGASSRVLEAFDSAVSPPTTWQRIIDTRVAPRGTAWIRVRLVSVNPGAEYTNVDVDDLSLRALGPDGSGAATVKNPRGLAVGPDGSLYVAAESRVWKRAADGTLTGVAGTGERGYGGDGGPALEAKLRKPWGVALGPDGSVYITDQADHRVRKVAPNGRISTLCGTGVSGASPPRL